MKMQMVVEETSQPSSLEEHVHTIFFLGLGSKAARSWLVCT